MKGLMGFFDYTKFFEGKQLIAVGAPKPWLSKDGKTELGTVLKLEVDQDETEYQKEGTDNVGEQFTVKSVQPLSAYKWVERHTPVVLSGITQATIYGDFNNGLSLRGDVAKAGK